MEDSRCAGEAPQRSLAVAAQADAHWLAAGAPLSAARSEKPILVCAALEITSRYFWPSPMTIEGLHWGVQLKVGAALRVDDLGIVAAHKHAWVLEALGIERDDVGDPKTLARGDQQFAQLDGDVGDGRVADGDFGRWARQPQQLDRS